MINIKIFGISMLFYQQKFDYKVVNIKGNKYMIFNFNFRFFIY